MENKEMEIKIGIVGGYGSYKSRIKIKLNIFDISHQEEFGDTLSRSIRRRDIFVLVYSITDKHSFEDIKYFDERIKRILNIEDKDYPKVLIGNNSDLTMKREISIKEGKKLAKELNCKYIETSAKNGENINQIFYETILLEIERLKTIKEENLNQKKKKKKKGKCLLM
ncbi:ras gtpase [Anaeramoeba ignava]|uniref:Ras gtpase n=1 Tax=Anaeramoeba ignava TaxID=1746090 RepID=A0A9Q0LEZ0_ANAIG|nr:ras gtpase [Anaeramoeba ignava]